MKPVLLFLNCLIIFSTAEAFTRLQIVSDSLLLSHYPLNTGNCWDYSGAADQTWWNRTFPKIMLKTITGDTLLPDGKTYKQVLVDEYGLDEKSTDYAIGYHTMRTDFIRIDSSTLEVYGFQFNFITKLDSLKAKVSDSFQRMSRTIFDTVILKDTSTLNLFEGRRFIRHLKEKQGIFEFYTAEGIGEISRISGSDNYFVSYYLSGAVINGDTVSSLLRIRDGGLKTSLTKLVFTPADTVQTVSLSNIEKGLTIIDSIKLKNSSKFYSYPSYRGGYYRSSVFSESPFPVFSGDHIEYNIYIRPEFRNTSFTDTLKIYSSGINGKKIPVINIPLICEEIIDAAGENPAGLPKIFELRQNYPNPFNPVTTISFSLPKDSNVELKVFDIRGIIIETLVSDYLKAGDYSVKFNAKGFSSGVYFYQLRAGGHIQNKKLVILK